ncbi:MAG: hypothetical protein Q4C63_03050 [Eubacteriales bacterium]|nr:hypothetical protein [Eubacteriales bacterium]
MKRSVYEPLPVTEALLQKAEQYEKETENRFLSGLVVLHINHCMENSFAFSALLERYFYHCVFAGVPYNDTMPEEDEAFLHCTGQRLPGDRYFLYEGETCFYEGSGDFLGMTERLIWRALSVQVLPFLKEGKRLLIIEDGGYHYPVLARFLSAYPEYQGRIAGAVEQTASGTLRMRAAGEKCGFGYPCCSISRSALKMRIESRFIGHRVTEELASFLYSANAFLDFHEVLILGYGIVGRQVSMDLKSRSCRITVRDTDARMEAAARRDGFATGLYQVFDRDLIVIGCSGADSFPKELLSAFLQGKANRLYLASASSQDREFAEFLRMAGGGEALPEGAVLTVREKSEFYTCYEISVKSNRKEIYLIAEGLPVNFYRKGGISLTHSVIDIIFADLLSAGLAFSFYPDMKNQLWLLGTGAFRPFVSEEEIASLWYRSYGLIPEDSALLPAGHPEMEYLTEKMLSEGSWRKNW